MRVSIYALLIAVSTASASMAQTEVIQPPELPGGQGVINAVPQTPNSTAVLEERIQRLEAQLQAQSGASQSGPAIQPSVGPLPAQATVVVDNSWRYKHHNGTWWYWLPSNRWVVWSNNSWIDYDPATYATQVYRAPTYYGYGGGGYGSRYSTGYRHAPHVGVGLYLGSGHGHGGFGHVGGHGGHGGVHIGHGGHGGHGGGHGGHGGGHGGHGGGHGGHGGGHGHH